MMHTLLFEGFLEGVVATTSLAAGLFFLRYWRDTRDSLFLAFSMAFFIEGVNRCVRIFFINPSEVRSLGLRRARFRLPHHPGRHCEQEPPNNVVIGAILSGCPLTILVAGTNKGAETESPHPSLCYSRFALSL